MRKPPKIVAVLLDEVDDDRVKARISDGAWTTVPVDLAEKWVRDGMVASEGPLNK